jgi:hypothetical protein
LASRALRDKVEFFFKLPFRNGNIQESKYNYQCSNKYGEFHFFFVGFSLKYGDCGPFFPEKINSFGQFAAPLLPFLFLVSKWPKFATKRKRKRKKTHIGDDARRRLQHMVSSAITMFQRLLKHS